MNFLKKKSVKMSNIAKKSERNLMDGLIKSAIRKHIETLTVSMKVDLLFVKQ